MLFIAFKAAGTRFALPARMVEEVTPLVSLAPLAGAPGYVAGVMNHRGRPLPVADMNVLLAGKPSRPFASTRIVVAEPRPGAKAGGRPALLGLMAERVFKTVELDEAAVSAPGAPAAPYIRGVAEHEGELVQILELGAILPAELLERLLAGLEAA
ncbi:chemotaxis protein CheW [Fundidesulfovibrio agrisoli]|uniref:chemotaxis protein CheW n=1 Tax=Fundidesulfovibrio agrisoli TaxID=2922717 RepID=UPI001FAC7A98|nr:chemotaxis protein CheW [Fundidesulfovibrio agrisoli]